MKKWTKFKNDRQINDWIAKDVMGWHKNKAYWHDSRDAAMYAFNSESADEFFVLFDLLTDQNHAAMVRAKMRDMGYRRWASDHDNRGGFIGVEVSWLHSEPPFVPVQPVLNRNELRAEMEAIFNAKQKERDDR